MSSASMICVAGLPAVPAAPASRRRHILYLAAVAAALLLIIGLGLRVDRPLTPGAGLPLLVNIAVQLTFTVAAALLYREPAQRRTAAILGAAALCQIAGGIRAEIPDPWYFVHAVIGPLFWVFAGWAVLRFPYDALLRREQRLFVLLSALWLGPGHTVVNVLMDPESRADRLPPHTWWPTLNDSHALFQSLTLAEVCVDAALACWYGAITVRRIRIMNGVDRWITAPMAASVVGSVGPLLVRPPAYLMGDTTVEQVADLAMVGVLVLIPAAFIAVLVRQRFTRSAIVDMMTGLQGPADLTRVVDALRTALRDPQLTVRFCSPETGTYVDADGREAIADERRMRVPVTASDGSHLAELVVDPELRQHGKLVDAAVSASALTLDNARLQAALRAQLEATRASRRRIAEAGVEERRRLERDLHDGVQQRLLALTLRLADMRAHGSDADTVVETTRAELHAALGELRELARGIHPTVLAQSGLGPALEDVADRLPFPVLLDIPACRWPATVEATAYFIVCEALSNVVKHADATCAQVNGSVVPGPALRVVVLDDGRGGAGTGAGTGLRGIQDRVRALGGQLTIESPDGAGTRLTIDLPCG